MFAHVHSTGRGYFSHAGGWYELVNKETSGTVGTGTETYNVGDITSSGSISAVTNLGIGTANPSNDIHLRKTGDTELQITSDTGTAGITLGRESSTSNINNAEIRYGQDSGADYSSAQSFDLINYGTGNFNYHLSADNASAVDGDFHWHKGLNNQRLMILTGIGGSLGVGTTLPTTTLDVLGDATFSGVVSIGATLSVGQLSVPSVATNVIGQLTGNVYATSGVSTFHKVDLNKSQFFESGQLQAEAIGIGTTMSNSVLVVNSDTNSQFRILNSGNVSVKGDDPHGNSLYVNGDIACDQFLFVGNDGINKNIAAGAVDFRNAGKRSHRFIR